MSYEYDVTDSDQFPVKTPAMEIIPERVQVLTTSTTVMKVLQPKMSKAPWAPSFRKLSFLVTQDEHLLGLIHLSSPLAMKPITARLGGISSQELSYHYANASVLVGAQPVSWYWNLGKMLALIAPTLGDVFEGRYGHDLRGIITTSLWGKGSQYNRIYEYLGVTDKGGHTHTGITPGKFERLKARAIADGFTKADVGIGHPLARYGDIETKTLPSNRWRPKGKYTTPCLKHAWFEGEPVPEIVPDPDQKCTCTGGDGSSAKLRLVKFLFTVYPDEAEPLDTGEARGIYYHDAIPPDQRPETIQGWYDRWGLRRWESKKGEKAPYQDGLS
jgi:hypothetical protein